MAVSVDDYRIPAGDDYDILLIGKTGTGKSSTGNSILRREEFRTAEGWQSVTRDFTIGHSRLDGRVLTVVDTPGFMDTHEVEESAQTDLVADSITRSLAQCPQGYHAFVLVISSTFRMGKTERETIKFWIDLIGEEAFKTRGIIALTFGEHLNDKFDNSIHKFWAAQSIQDQLFLEMCERRCVVFQNKTKDFVVSRKQVYDLVVSIDNMKELGPHIPTICQFPEISEEVVKNEREYLTRITKFNKLFGLLRESVGNLVTLDTLADQEKALKRIEEDVQSLKKELSHTGGSVNTQVKAQFLVVQEKLRELEIEIGGTGGGDENNRGSAVVDTMMAIHKVQVKLNEMAENTKYWKWVRKNALKATPVVLGILGIAGIIAFVPAGVLEAVGTAAVCAFNFAKNWLRG